jgi:hypothetical protein
MKVMSPGDAALLKSIIVLSSELEGGVLTRAQVVDGSRCNYETFLVDTSNKEGMSRFGELMKLLGVKAENVLYGMEGIQYYRKEGEAEWRTLTTA